MWFATLAGDKVAALPSIVLQEALANRHREELCICFKMQPS